jgi:3-hydroxybutyryl-CoA dehydrogenase
MKIAVLADDNTRKEWESKGVSRGVEVEWPGSMRVLTACHADAYFDLQFENDPERTGKLLMRADKPVFVNAVMDTTVGIGHPFIRINAWPGFLNRSITELAAGHQDQEKQAAELMSSLGWACQFVPDIPGMLSARIIGAIINEAYFAWGEGISSKKEIDIAMKLGTNYPMGPFEWCEKIGLRRVYDLLFRLSRMDERYDIAPALLAEAMAPAAAPGE